MAIKPTTVFVSGANGYMAQHIIKLLLEKVYNVVGSVRSTEKGEHLKTLLKGYENRFTYEVIPDIAKEDACYKALQSHPEATVFIHTATSSPISDDVEEGILIPAVSGTKNVLKAIKKYAPQVTNFVYTSSCATAAPIGDFGRPGLTIDESSWNPVTWEQAKNGGDTYSPVKTFTERAVWDFVEAEKPNFVANAILPTYCLGPQAYEVKGPLSNFVARVLNMTPDSEIREFNSVFIDVRDVAKAHIAAFEDKSIRGERLLLINSHFSYQMLVDIVGKNFPELKPRLPVSDPNKFIQFPGINNAKTRKLLGWEFNSLEAATVDAAKQILEAKAQ